MRIVVGKKTEEMDRDAVSSLARGHRGVLVDVGAGTGKYVYETARQHPDMLCIGMDAEQRNLAQVSARARRKAARGGTPNALFVLAAAESPPPELAGLATHVSVNLPWGSLLQGIALGQEALLRTLADIARPGAVLEVLLCYSSRYEPRMMQELGLPELTPDQISESLIPTYAEARIRIESAEVFGNEAVKRLPLAWGKTLSRRRPREFHYLVGRLGNAPGEGATPLLRAHLESDKGSLAADAVRFSAFGHPKIRATHAASIEFTRDHDVTERGNCVLGVRADIHPDKLSRLLDYRKLSVTLRCGGVEDVFECGVNSGFDDAKEIVFRRSAYRSARTLGIRASKGAAQIDRRLACELRNAAQQIDVTISPSKPLRRAR